MGSHLDTQPKGGRFDGILGVLAGLEVFRTLEDQGIVTERPLALVVWTNEEGSRFAPAMVASGTYAGAFSVESTLAREDRDGVTLGEALEACATPVSCRWASPVWTASSSCISSRGRCSRKKARPSAW